ncbi:MAG: DUF4390 domain-containing protein [Magnetococcales bacterium]|nr:DUF4390 domain-containing protein [Magnetococcales bacterium]
MIPSRPVTAWIALLAILLSGCGRDPLPENTPVIQEASPVFQSDKLFAQVSLNPTFQDKIELQLKQGDPLLATYRFTVMRLHEWLPNVRILDKEIQRHIRMRLITERYELREENSSLVHYTSDEDEAMSFFANPRFILLHSRFKPLPGVHYQLQTRVSITQEGMSRMFRLLDRWLTLNQSMDFTHLSELP